jgi:hypothetical protein
MPATLDDAAEIADRLDEFQDDGNPLGTRDRGHFPGSEFVYYANIPIFAEHRTTTASGRELLFTRRELQAVCDRCNQRINDTGDYAAVIVGHTADPKALASGQAKSSPAVGFAGPFRLGRIGDGGKQRWAILADFHIYRSQADVIRQYPRRSPELWLESRYEDMFLDPIALLGGEAPRLDMGLLYSATKGGKQVEKYAAASPGASNVVIPVHGDRDPANVKKFDSQTQTRSQKQMALSTEDLKQITDAISQMDVFAWAKSKMEAESGAASSEVDDKSDDAKDYAAGDVDEDEKDKDDEMKDKVAKENYSRLARENVKLANTVAALKKQVETETAKRVDNERYAKIADLAERFVVDTDEEFEQVRYGKADDAAFDRHCDRIQKRYQPILTGIEAPVPEGTERYSRGAGQESSKAKYSREQTDRAMQLARESINRGVPMSFDAAMTQVASGK